MLCKKRQFDCLLLASWSWWRVGHVETCKCNEPPPDICLRPFLHRDKPANYEHLALIWKISRKYLENISRYSVNARPISCAVAKTWLCIWLCSHQILFYKFCPEQKMALSSTSCSWKVQIEKRMSLTWLPTFVWPSFEWTWQESSLIKGQLPR